MLSPRFPIGTRRLRLRPLRPEALDALADIQSRPEVVRHLYRDVRDRAAHCRQNEMVKREWTDEVVYAMLADDWRAAERPA